MRQQPYVRRIIGGATYNTATSSLLGTANRENVEATLHRTRTGAYFEVRRSERRWHDRRAGEWRTDALIDVVPLDREAASKWCEEHGVMLEADALLEDGGSEATAPASYPLRMPDILKRRLEGEARASGLSLNAFILRRLEAPAKPAINARAASAIKITPAVHPATVLQDEILPSVGMTTNAFAPHIGLSKQAISKSAMKGERLKNDTVHRT